MNSGKAKNRPGRARKRASKKFLAPGKYLESIFNIVIHL